MSISDREEERYFPLVELPLPPTDNRLKRPTIRRKNGEPIPFNVPTKEYAQFKKDVAARWAAWAATNPDFKPYNPDKNNWLLFNFVLYLPNYKRDAQNHTKALRDALSGKLYTDDRYLYVFPSTTHAPIIDKYNPRIILDPNPSLLLLADEMPTNQTINVDVIS